MYGLNLIEVKNDLSVRSKNGIAFLLSGTIMWSIILVIFLLPFGLNEKNIYMFISTGLMFPLSVLISRVIKADWKPDDNPLGSLGLFLNLAQFMYFPIVFWAFIKSPNEMLLFFSVITGAHFFPYGWFYNTKAYSMMAPLISIIMIVIGWTNDGDLWYIPATMVPLLIILIVWLYIDYKKKCVS